jgi:hypothetical protein
MTEAAHSSFKLTGHHTLQSRPRKNAYFPYPQSNINHPRLYLDRDGGGGEWSTFTWTYSLS